MRRHVLAALGIATLVNLWLAQLSLAVPPLPFAAFGTAKIDDEYVEAGTQVAAWCGGVQVASTAVSIVDGESWYLIEVPGDDPDTPQKDGCLVGETVEFTVGGCKADQSVLWQSGDTSRLDLTAIRPRPSLATRKLTNGQDANIPPGPYVLVGQTVNWTYLVTNTGNVTLTNVGVTDNRGVVVSCPKNVLGPGLAMACSASSSAAAGQYSNTGTARGTYTTTLTASDPSHYFGAQTFINIEKYTNGQDADLAPGLYLVPGSAVIWTYLVTNTGNVTLTELAVSDNRGVSVSCPKTVLGPGSGMTCTASGTVQEGQYANQGSVSGTPPGGLPTVADQDPSHYFGARVRADLQKKTNGQDANSPPGPYILVGQAVTWAYGVTNTGNVTLTGVALSDNQRGTISCPQSTLAAGAAMTCTASGAAAQGQYQNLGSVTGTPPGGLPNATDSDPSHYFGATPSLAIQKFTNGQDADSPPGPYILVGQAVTWTYRITNTGNVTLTGVALSDNQRGTISCPQNTLAPGVAMTCTANGTATRGQYANTGTVTGTPPGGLVPVSASESSHYFGADPSLAIQKTTNGQDADSPPGPYILVDQPVTWTYVVTNTGNVALTGVSVSDSDPALELTCQANALNPDQSTQCMASGVAVEGQYANTGTASGTPPVGSGVGASDPSHYFGAHPSIAVSKVTAGEEADAPPGPTLLAGGPVTWTYRITNTGNVVLSGVTLTDSDPAVQVDCQANALNPDQSTLCTAGGVVLAGQYANTGTASGTPPGGLGAVQGADVSHYFGAAPSIRLEKVTNGVGMATVEPGEAVTWTYAIFNTGNVTVTNLSVVDEPEGDIPCPPASLGAGQSLQCVKTGTAITEGEYANVATATGTALVGVQVVGVTGQDASGYRVGGGGVYLPIVLKSMGP